MKTLDKKVESLIDLHAEDAITTAQFKERNASISKEKLDLYNEKTSLELKSGEEKNLDSNVQAFKKMAQLFLSLKTDDKQAMKRFLRSLISRIEVADDGEITKIQFNLNGSWGNR